MKTNPWMIPVLRAEFVLADGTVLKQDFTMAAVEGHPLVELLRGASPSWLLNRRKVWSHPQDPITFRAEVQEGFEEEARALFTPGKGRP